MIRLIRYDGIEILLNVELLLSVHEGSDGTHITLNDGETIRVKNTPADIATKVQAYRMGVEAEEQTCNESINPAADKRNRSNSHTEKKSNVKSPETQLSQEKPEEYS